MKFKILNIVILVLSVLQLYAQDFKPLTQKQYISSFPLSFDVGQFYPNTNVVIILPTNELDKELQNKMNDFYKSEFIDKLIIIPPDTLILLTDKEALVKDLSNTNIYAFGTKDGNLWTAQFLENNKAFPFKIEKDSIVTDKVYLGDNNILQAVWYNPFNINHSLFLYIPQNIKYANNSKRAVLNQYYIWKNKKNIAENNNYHLRNGQWVFCNSLDSILFQYQESQKFDSSPYKKIENFFYKYPDYDLVKECPINQRDIPIDTIKLFDNNCNYNYISDLKWIKNIAQQNKIIALGEQHHLKQNTYLLRRLVFALNTYDYYPILICEIPFSYGAYFNYYLNECDEETASAFRNNVLTMLLPSFIPTLDCLREWNKQKPKKSIEIGCSDLEHDFLKTYNLILEPYLKKIDSTFHFQFNSNYANYPELFTKVEILILKAIRENINGEFPFQTAAYMESVVENLKSTIPIKIDSKNSKDKNERFKIMIRNLTDTMFLGKLIANNKCFFYGGADHFKTLRNKEQNQMTEGYYLANYFEPTKGKVFSIELIPLSYSIEDSIQCIDPRLNYRLEMDLIKLYQSEKIKLYESIILGEIQNEIEKYIYKISFQYPGYAFKINSFNEYNIYKKYYGLKRFNVWADLMYNQSKNTNTIIFVPKSYIGDY